MTHLELFAHGNQELVADIQSETEQESENRDAPNQPSHSCLLRFASKAFATLLGEGGVNTGKNLSKLQPKRTSFFEHIFVTAPSGSTS